MAESTTAYIGLGTNLGDRNAQIQNALNMLAGDKDINLLSVSDIIETDALAKPDQPKYLNAVAKIETTLSPESLHVRTGDIENALGRERTGKWAPRTIDLDILLFADKIINRPRLTVPHRQMHLRSFVLKGLSQLNGSIVHPVLKEPVDVLAARLCSADFTFNPDLPQLISIAGIIGVGKTTLVKKLANTLDAEGIFEPYDTNPYLPVVYAGNKDKALDSQLYFLNHRIKQLNKDKLQPHRLYITDYIFDKELIYAEQTLDAGQLASYKKAYHPLISQVVQPVLVIYLTDAIEDCLKRIHRRNRAYEQKIKPQFLQDLNTAYQNLFESWKISPVIRILMSQFDCAQKDDIEHLADQIRAYVAV